MRSILIIGALCSVMSLAVCSRGRDRCCGLYETDHGYVIMDDRQDCGRCRPVAIARDYYDDEYRTGAFGYHRGDYHGRRYDGYRYDRRYRNYYGRYGDRDRDSCDQHRYPYRARYRDYDESVSERYIPPVSTDSVNYEE